MKKQKEIPKNEWEEFLKIFSRQHKEWLITVKQNGDASIQNQPLAEIRIGQGKIFLGAGDYFLVIEQPLSVFLTTTAEGADESLEIDAQSGKISLIIETPVLPEMVDGVP